MNVINDIVNGRSSNASSTGLMQPAIQNA